MSSELGRVSRSQNLDSRETKIHPPDSREGLGQPQLKAFPPNFGILPRDLDRRDNELGPGVSKITEVPSPVYSGKELTRKRMVIVATIRADRAKVSGLAGDSGQLELKVRISIDRSGTSRTVRTKILKVKGAPSESPALARALSKWAAESITTLPFEKLKEGLPAASDKVWQIDASADFIEYANNQAHELAGTVVEGVAADAGAPPELATVAEGVLEHSEIPVLDDLTDKIVEPLRLTGIFLDIAAGGLPVSGLVELILDGIKKDIEHSICEALTPGSRGSQVHVDRPSQGKIETPDPAAVVYTQLDAGFRSKNS